MKKSPGTEAEAMDANGITAELVLRINSQLPFIRVWRNNRVNAKATGKGGKDTRVNAGIDGQGDICGIIGQSASNNYLGGTMLQIETKAGKDRLSPVQKGFRAMIRSRGGVYLVARNVEEAMAGLRALTMTAPKGEYDSRTETAALRPLSLDAGADQAEAGLVHGEPENGH